MAKMNMATIKVVDVENNTIWAQHSTETTPKKSTLGNSYFGTLNSKGIQKLQVAGHTINSEKDWCSLLKTTFGLTDEELGNRGPAWSSAQDRAKYKVYLNDVEFNPDFTAKQMEKQAQSNAQPKEVTPQAQVVIPQTAPEVVIPKTQPEVIIPQAQPEVVIPQQAVADTVQVMAPTIEQKPQLTGEEIGYVTLMENYIKQGKFNNEQLIGTLAKKVGQQKAELIFSLAKGPAF